MFTVGGYPKRGNPIFGLVMNIYENRPNLGDDDKPYTTLGYANGLGGINGTRENLTGVNTGDKDFRQQATVLRYKETHGLEDVGKGSFTPFVLYMKKELIPLTLLVYGRQSSASRH